MREIDGTARMQAAEENLDGGGGGDDELDGAQSLEPSRPAAPAVVRCAGTTEVVSATRPPRIGRDCLHATATAA